MTQNLIRQTYGMADQTCDPWGLQDKWFMFILSNQNGFSNPYQLDKSISSLRVV